MNLGACSALKTLPLTGVWYRALPLAHLQTALQTSQTRFIPGRFNPGSGGFDVLYLCENQFVAFMEVGATFGSLTNIIPNPAVAWAALNVRVTLNAIADLTNGLAALDTNAQELTGDWRGFLTFSAKMPAYRCLVVLPNKLHPTSSVEFFDPSGSLIHRIP